MSELKQELKPCMKCGSYDVEHYWYEPAFAESEGHEAQCNQCGLSSGEFLTFELLESFWNTRDNKQAKREAINELLALHEQDRAKANSQCDTLINMSTVRKYLDTL